MLDWFHDLTRTERRTLGACFGGWALDALDVQVYSFVIPTLIAAHIVTGPQAGILGTVVLLLSAVGGWVTGMLSDRFGRVRMLQVTVVWYAFFTFLCGFANSYEQLFVFRALQGIGFGGEWAAGSVLMGEVIRAQYRGRAVGTVQSGWAVGWGTAAILYTVFFTVLPTEQAWRAMFWIGLLPAAFVFYIRRFVEEPGISAAARSHAQEQGMGQLVAIFSPELWRTTVIAALMTTGAQGGYYALSVWLPTFLKTERHLSVLNTGGYSLFLIFGSFCGFICGAYLCDRIGRRATFFGFAVSAAILVYAYTVLPISDQAMLFLGFPLGFFANGMFSPMGPFLTELFPSRVRGTAQGFVYNAGRAVGALFPLFVGFLSQSMALGRAIAIFAITAYGLMFLALLALPETRGRELTA